MDEGCLAVIGIIVAVVVALWIVFYAVLIVLLLIVSVAESVFTLGDLLFGASLIPSQPWIAWIAGGMLVGAAAGFWTVAPVYGWRDTKQRILLAAPCFFFVLIAFLGMAEA